MAQKVRNFRKSNRKSLGRKLKKKWQMKEDNSGDYIWIPFTDLKIEFNDAKSGRFQFFVH